MKNAATENDTTSRAGRQLLLVSLGLALCFAFRSADRYTAIAFPNQNSLLDSILLGTSRLAPLIVLALAYRRRGAFLPKPSGVESLLEGFFIPFIPRLLFLGLMATVGLSVLYVSSFGLPVTAEAITVGKMLLGVANTLFLVTYAELALPLGRSATITVFVTASYLFGVLRIALGLLSPQAALVLLLLCPALSCLCLYESIDRCPATANAACPPSPGNAKRPESSSLLSGYTISLFVSIAAYTFIFSSLHVKWLNPSSSSPLIAVALQAAPGLGIIAGAYFISKVQGYLTIERLASYSMLLPPLAMAVLYLSTFASDYLLIAFAIPLFAVQRMVFFLIWIIAVSQGRPLRQMLAFCIGMSCLELGTSTFYCVAGIVKLAGGGQDSLFFPTVVVLALLITQQIVIWLFSEKRQSEKKAQDEREAAEKTDSDLISKELTESIEGVANHYRLTKRERELLPYLMLGRAPDYIGQAMFIEPSTVKTHIKNIYRKVNVSKRTDLLLLIENWNDSPKD